MIDTSRRLSCMRLTTGGAALVTAAALAGPAAPPDTPARPATAATVAANAAVLESLPFSDRQDFADATRGLIAPLPQGGRVRAADGRVVWDLARHALAGEAAAPPTVNPSLWRQWQLLSIAGLFEVTPRIYQVRGTDIANITFIEGDTGVVVLDAGFTVETARAALTLYREHRGPRPVVAVIHTHSHIDHFGGVGGLVEEADVRAGRVRVVAPAGFVEEAVSENVVAGNHMRRRVTYMFGTLLEPGPRGAASAGLGLAVPAGTTTLIAPTDIVERTGQTLELDGLTFELLLAPDTEAPAEMHVYLPALRALTVAENASHVQHNLYTLRGAKVRDAAAWSGALDASLARWGAQVEVLYGPHHWPTWGNAAVREHLARQRDLYRYLHDQTLRLANHGYTMTEAAEAIELPPELARHWANRGYYGTLRNNVKAVWTHTLGFADGNPARLEPLPPRAAGRRYVEYMGGADAVLRRAREDFAAGEYRWVAQVLDHVVSADPDNAPARELLADALEQLGYQAESAPLRNFHLTGAQELREGVRRRAAPQIASPGILRAMPMPLFFDAMAVRLNGPRAAGRRIAVNLDLADTGERYGLVLENAVLHHGPPLGRPDGTLTIAREPFTAIVLGQATLAQQRAAGTATVAGDPGAFDALLALLDTFDLWWNVATPAAE